MLPVTRIIWPTDFSEPSYNALAVAEELARHFSAELILVHITNQAPYMAAALPVSPSTPASTSFDIVELQERVRKQSEEQLEQLIREHLDPALHTRILVVAGRPAEEIVEIAENEQADLIVISTHGRTGVRHFLFGSVAEKVVRTAACPVLTVRVPHPVEAVAVGAGHG